MGHQGIGGQEKLDDLQEVPSLFQRKSRRKVAVGEKVRERNTAGLKGGAKSRIPELLRKVCLSPSNIMER